MYLKSFIKPFFEAAQESDARKVRDLLKGGQDPNARSSGATALHFATYAGHKEVVEAIIAAHADIDAKEGYGISVLDTAVMGDREGIVEPLISLVLKQARF